MCVLDGLDVALSGVVIEMVELMDACLWAGSNFVELPSFMKPDVARTFITVTGNPKQPHELGRLRLMTLITWPTPGPSHTAHEYVLDPTTNRIVAYKLEMELMAFLDGVMEETKWRMHVVL